MDIIPVTFVSTNWLFSAPVTQMPFASPLPDAVMPEIVVDAKVFEFEPGLIRIPTTCPPLTSETSTESKLLSDEASKQMALRCLPASGPIPVTTMLEIVHLVAPDI
ncbi:hypothetical protein ES708_25860 [subsurface metagenome]